VDKVKHGSASWGNRGGGRRNVTTNFISSWADRPRKRCEPLAKWIEEEWLPAAATRGQASVLCSMAPHQGLGDQMKGVMRCWATALATSSPLVFDHTHSRSSWLWADAESVRPAELVRRFVDFKGIGDGKAPAAKGSSATDERGVRIGQGFKVSEGVLPCGDAQEKRLGGIAPFLGLRPVLFNLEAGARKDPERCGPLVARALRLQKAMERTEVINNTYIE
jgi:hypothetical protein